MKRYYLFRGMLLILVAASILFSPLPETLVDAQDKDSCRADQEGWSPTYESEVDLTGRWTWVAATDCRNGWGWSGTIGISGSPGRYKVTDFGNDGTVTISGNQARFNRDLGSYKDKNGANIQMWRGQIQRHRDGRIRIYGEFSGAWDYSATEAKKNHDFKMIKQ